VSAAWAGSVIAMVTCVLAIAGLVYKAGRREGKLDEVLERLTDIADDHEDRLRALEPWGVSRRDAGRPARGAQHRRG
jgi:hypothetical protein